LDAGLPLVLLFCSAEFLLLVSFYRHSYCLVANDFQSKQVELFAADNMAFGLGDAAAPLQTKKG